MSESLTPSAPFVRSTDTVSSSVLTRPSSLTQAITAAASGSAPSTSSTAPNISVSHFSVRNQSNTNTTAANSRCFSLRKPSADINRSCWVCFATEDDYESREEVSGGWLKPCKCRNTTKWVHQHCLQRWIDEKQRGNPNTPVACPQCSHPYVIELPKQSRFIKFLDIYEKWIQKSCPILAAAFAAGAVYWTSVSYGAFTIMQIFGAREGLELIEKGDPLFLLIVMPAIPICLVLGKLVKWEDLVLKLWRKHSKKVLDVFHSSSDRQSYAYRNETSAMAGQAAQQAARDPVEAAIISDPVSATRVLCGALVLPTISLFSGKMLFSHVQPSLQRTILGGISFIVCKGILKMYFRQQQFLRTLRRQIQNCNDNDQQITAINNSIDRETTHSLPSSPGSGSEEINQPEFLFNDESQYNDAFLSD